MIEGENMLSHKKMISRLLSSMTHYGHLLLLKTIWHMNY